MSSSDWSSLTPRAEELWFRAWEDSPVVTSAQGFNFYGNTSSAFINELKFAAAKSVRTSFIVLASFNVLAAVGVIFGVFLDSIVAARKDDPKFKFRPWSLWIIGPAEVYPFVLSMGILVQGIIFAVVQSRGLESLMILGCEPLSQTTMSALFIVPFLQLIFGLETTVRGFMRQPFDTRPIWLVPTLVAIVIVGLLIMFGLTQLAMPPNFCFASLMWFVERWGVQIFGILVGICACLVAGGIATFLRLTHSARVEPTERSAASQMVYYMFAGLLSNGLMIPFFYCISFSHPMASDLYPAQLAMVAAVVANVSGIVTGVLYLFLRSSRFSGIGARGYQNTEQQQRNKLGIQIRRSQTSGYSNQVQEQVSPSWLFANESNNYEGYQREKHEEERIDSPRRAPQTPAGLSRAQLDSPTQSWPPLLLPQTTYSPQDNLNAKGQAGGPLKSTTLDAPRPVFSMMQQALLSPATAAALLPPPPGILASHRRDSSLGSATVQIGLRLSNVNDVEGRVTLQPEQPGKIHELGCPKQLGSTSTRTTHQDSPTRAASSIYNTSPSAESPDDDGIRLSPTVYSPNAVVKPLNLKSPASTTGTASTRPWPLSRDAPSMLNAQPKSINWI